MKPQKRRSMSENEEPAGPLWPPELPDRQQWAGEKSAASYLLFVVICQDHVVGLTAQPC
jgi:hypothetical protein